MEKVVVVCNKSPFPDIDGGTSATRSLIQGLLNIGHEVHAIIFDTYKHPVLDENLFDEWKNAAFSYKALHVETKIKPLSAIQNLLFCSESIHITRVQDERITQFIQTEIDSLNVNLVIFDGLFALAQIPALNKQNRKFVYRAHNIEHVVWEKVAQNSNFPRSFYVRLMAKRLKKFEVKVLSKIDQVWAISTDTAKFFQERNVNTEVVYPTFPISDSDTIEHTPNYERLALFHIGAMDWLPNLEAIDYFYLEILPKFSEAFPNSIFYVGGRNFPKGRYKESNNFKVVGEIESYQDFVADMDILVVPLLSGSGIRMKIGETMAMGIPVMATKVAMEGIPAVPGTHYLAFENAIEFVEALRKIVSNPYLFNKLAFAGRDLALNYFSKQKLASQLNRILSDLNKA